MLTTTWPAWQSWNGIWWICESSRVLSQFDELKKRKKVKRRIDGLLEASGWCRDRLLWAFFAKSISNIKSFIIIIKDSHGSLSLYHHHPHFLERIDHRNLVGLATRSPRDPFSRETKKKKRQSRWISSHVSWVLYVWWLFSWDWGCFFFLDLMIFQKKEEYD